MDSVDITTAWGMDARLTLVVSHEGEQLYAGQIDSLDDEDIAVVAMKVADCNGFQDREGLAMVIEERLRKERNRAPLPPPDIIDLRQGGDFTPPFPLADLPEWLRDWVVAWSTRMEMAPEIAVGVALGVIAGVLQRGAVVDVDETWEGEPLCLWVMPLAPPSAGKTPVFKAATKVVDEMISEQLEEWKTSNEDIQSVRRGLEARQVAAEKRFASADPNEELVARSEMREIVERLRDLEAPPSPAWIMADATKESIRKKFDATHGYAAVLDDEATFLNNTVGGRYAKSQNSDEMDTLRKAFNGQVLPTDRSGHEFGYHGKCHLTILQVVQPQVIATMQASAAAMGRGTFARFLMLWPSQDNIGTRTFNGGLVPKHVTHAFDGRMRQLFEQSEARLGDPVRFRLSEAANRMRLEFNRRYEASRRDADPLVVEGDGKLFGSVVVRIAGMLYAMDRGLDAREAIDPKTMERAIRIVETFRAHLAKTIGGMRRDPRTEDALAVIEVTRRNFSGTEVRLSGIRKRMKWNRSWSVDRTNSALALLEAHNWLAIDRKAGLGKLHPQFYTYETPQNPQLSV